jgi:hypothetical protein
MFWPRGPQAGDLVLGGLSARVMPCPALVHDFPPLSAVSGADSDSLPGPGAP